MLHIGVIGTAGRKDDSALMNKALYNQMYSILLSDLKNFEGSKITLVSGGAAWSDHLAVRAFLDKQVEDLKLYLPAPFKNSEFEEFYSAKLTPGRIANYYHQMMEHRGIDSRKQIQISIDQGAKVYIRKNFWERNLDVAKVDVLIAFTFGTKSGSSQARAIEAGLKDGGTAHTWDHSIAPLKIHHNLYELL